MTEKNVCKYRWGLKMWGNQQLECGQRWQLIYSYSWNCLGQTLTQMSVVKESVHPKFQYTRVADIPCSQRNLSIHLEASIMHPSSKKIYTNVASIQTDGINLVSTCLLSFFYLFPHARLGRRCEVFVNKGCTPQPSPCSRHARRRYDECMVVHDMHSYMLYLYGMLLRY